MADLKIIADKIVTGADKIKTLNIQMRDDFDNVQNAINTLNKSWDGQASTNAFEKFGAIKNAYCEARYTVVDNYVAFLYQQIGEGYESTELANKSLADAFK